jgi:DNA/RNA endonuclease G (NUC1)
MWPDMIVACAILLGSVQSQFLSPLPLTGFFYFSQTAEHLTLASLGKSKSLVESTTEGGDRGKSTFQEDESLPVAFRSKLLDYFRSGYDRGHMCVYLSRIFAS